MTELAPRRHPESEMLAEFVDGRLEGSELSTITDHLLECEECREIAGATAAFVREEEAKAEAPKQRASPWWIGLAAAAVLVAALAIPLVRDSGRWSSGSIRSLVAAAPNDARPIEPRLSGGFAWAPVARVMRGAEDRASARLLLADHEIQQALEKRRTARTLHAAGVADALLGRTGSAVAKLREASELASGDASIRSDLAAAHYAGGDYEASLQEADKALALDPDQGEARFNRALALEALGRRDEALAAWNDYLAIDDSSEWAGEARERLARPR
ncbi:MAG TPA: tetratricopeptide repeat protein [Thermoanaerobaculia bacterium]|nr:tetratricopeptide repeat protein [Thermoanaerobaculia bacterium]